MASESNGGKLLLENSFPDTGSCFENATKEGKTFFKKSEETRLKILEEYNGNKFYNQLDK